MLKQKKGQASECVTHVCHASRNVPIYRGISRFLLWRWGGITEPHSWRSARVRGKVPIWRTATILSTIPYVPYIPHSPSAMLCVYPFCPQARRADTMGRQSFGTIDKRGTASKPRYRARFDDPTYTGPGRAPCITAPHTFPTKREAEIWLTAQWSAIAAGTWEHPATIAAREAEATRQQSLKGPTVAEWTTAWLADLERTAAGTLRKR